MMKYLALFAVAVASPAIAQDAAAGATTFKQSCQMCHAAIPGKKNPLGPNLVGIFGRKAAAGDFNYSEAMKKFGRVWDAATLDAYLAGPTKLVPGSRMPLALSNEKQRADVIAYLQSLGK